MKLKLINPRHYFNEFKQLSKFVITPVYNSNNALTIGQKITGTWTLFVVKILLTIVFGVSIGIFYDPENRTTISMAERFSPPALLLISVFALPLLEEIAFRLSLEFKPIFLAMTLGVLGYYIASKAIYNAKLSDVHHDFNVRIIIALTILIVSYPLFSIPKITRGLKLFWENNFRWILYVFCLGFAWMHIFNYELTFEHLIMMPVITLPKLVNALCYGYVRINYGFTYTLAIHVCTNSIAFLANTLSG